MTLIVGAVNVFVKNADYFTIENISPRKEGKMLSEEEAKTKWCPYSRTVQWVQDGDGEIIGAASGNRASAMADECACIASECMAFRWIPDAVAVLSKETVITDEQDKELLNGAHWDGKYARCKEGRIHRLIATKAFGKIPDEMFVDHIDGDTRNNRRGNLRIVTKQQNATNSAPRGGKSQYRGVHQQASGRWAAQITREGVRACLGTYDTEEDAAKAYDDAAKNIHGTHARLNLEPIRNSGRHGYCGLAGEPK